VPGPGGERAVWSGRLVPEKAPHLAIDAARSAGFAIDLVGPVQDHDYVAREVLPRLGPDVVHHGHLAGAELVRMIGSAAVAVVSPVWDEPYGLVAAEALACGTPVAAFARGALPEIVDDSCGALAAAGDVDALARAIGIAAGRDRTAARLRAETRCDVDRMVDSYEALYRELAGLEAAA
jgi:glycosyltransferase involved in cell wall biosynthesis